MIATLQRFWDDKVTLWEFKGWWKHPPIYMIAPPWKDNKPDISCMPQGLYNVTRGDTSSHKDVFKILNVPNRTNILIHPGNCASDVILGKEVHATDSKGCFLPGFGYIKSTPMVTSSVKAMEYLRENIKDNFTLEVRFMLPPEEIKS